MPHRRLRWLRRILLALGALVLVAVAGLLITLHTDWGRDQVRRRVLAMLHDSFPGCLRIGRIDGSVLGDLHLRDVVACDASGREAIRARDVRVNLGLLALARGEIEVDTLDADGVTVLAIARTGQPLNLATVHKPAEQKSTWDVSLPDVRVRDLDVTIDRDGTIEHLDDLAIEASAALPADGPTTARFALTGTARERGRAPLALSGAVWSDERGVVVPVAHAGLGDATIDIDALSYRGATAELPGAVRGAIAVRAPDGVLRQVAPELGLGAAIDAWAAADLALRPDAPGLHAAEGDVIVTGRGAAAGLGPDRLDASIVVHDGVARLLAQAVGAGKTEATMRARATMEDEALLVRDARLDATVGSLAVASQQRLPVDGRARVELDGSARLAKQGTDLTVHATARADALHTHDRGLAIGHVFFDLAATGEPRHMRGQARLEVKDADRVTRQGRARVVEQLPDVGVTVKGGISGPLAIDLDAKSRTWKANGVIGTRVVLGPPDDPRLLATIDIGTYRFDLPRTRIEGNGGRVTIERDRLVVRDIHLRGSGATLALDATAGRGARSGDVDAKIDLRHLDLGRLRGVPTLPPDLAGTVALRTDVRKRGHALSGDIAASATGLVLHRGAIPVDLTVNAGLAPRRLNLGVSARGRALGSLAATANVAAPARLDDLRGWKRLERTAIDELTLRARSLDVARLAEAAGQEPSAEGILDADISLAHGQGTIALLGHGLVVPGAPAPIDLDVDLDLARGDRLGVSGRGALRELGDVSLTTSVDLPARPFDPAAWQRADLRRSLAAVDATIHEIDLDESRAVRLGVPALRGRFAGTVHVEPALGPVTAHLAGRDVLYGPLVTPAVITLDSTVERDASHAQLEVSLEGKPVAHGELRLPVGLARALAGTIDPAALPIDGKVTIPPTPVAVITRALGRDRNLGGTLHGDVVLGGTGAAPTATLAMVVNDLGASRARAADSPRGVIRVLTVDARYRDGAVHGELKGKAADGGDLYAIAEVDPAAPDAAHARIQATRFQLGPLARAVPEALLGVRGVLDADLELRGLDPDTARLAGTLRVRDAQAPLADVVGALRDGTIDVSVTGNRLRASMKGAVDAGHLEATATAELRGLLPDSAQLDATVGSLTLITTSAPKIAGKLHVDVVRDADRWRAVARVHDANVNVPSGEGHALHPAGPPPDMVFTSDLRPGAEIPRTRATMMRDWIGTRPRDPLVELEVVISPVTVVSDQLRGTVGGRLKVAIGADGASVDGRISAINGKVLLFDRRYGIERADLVFDGTIDPLLDIQLAYEFPQLRMHVSLIGRLSKPELTLSADPNTYTEGELLAILLGGTPNSPGAPAPDRSMASVAAAAAGQLVGSYFVSKLPVRIDVARYEAVTAESSAALVIGRWLTSTTLLLLRTRLEPRPDENNNEVEIETWLTPRLLFQGSAGDRGVLGSDLLWNKRW